ncbi:hypothetical protein HF086_017166 [Spodoptera exigua]|uniref:Uncharacterized protein n=1 Tax=Spodoptera exigua TaxID=7107 RepID=A0A922MK43_SPOEX|nr:hypothetical protein HF086_017166 [Spodoptera exigua]
MAHGNDVNAITTHAMVLLRIYNHKRTEQAYSSDEDAGIDMTIDNMSETSAQSDLKSIHDDPGSETQRDFKFEAPRPFLKKIVKEPEARLKELMEQHIRYYRPPPPPPEPEPVIDHKALRGL